MSCGTEKGELRSNQVHSYVAEFGSFHCTSIHDHDQGLAQVPRYTLLQLTDMASISKSEKSYIRESLRSTPAFREDGRSLSDFRNVYLETGIAPLANGSARVNLGKAAQEGGGGTEAIAAVKLEVEDVQLGGGADGGRIVCNVSWCAPRKLPADSRD